LEFLVLAPPIRPDPGQIGGIKQKARPEFSQYPLRVYKKAIDQALQRFEVRTVACSVYKFGLPMAYIGDVGHRDVQM